MQTVLTDEEVLELEIWRLALAETFVNGHRGIYNQLDGLSQHDLVEKYLAAFPIRQRWRDDHVAAGTCRQAAQKVQEQRLAILAAQPNRQPPPAADIPRVGNWFDEVIAPGVRVRFSAFTAADLDPVVPRLDPPTIEHEAPPTAIEAPQKHRGGRPATVRGDVAMWLEKQSDTDRLSDTKLADIYIADGGIGDVGTVRKTIGKLRKKPG